MSGSLPSAEVNESPSNYDNYNFWSRWRHGENDTELTDVLFYQEQYCSSQYNRVLYFIYYDIRPMVIIVEV